MGLQHSSCGLTSFFWTQVYLQAQGTGGNLADDWNARFSSMMFKVLQGTYQASPLAAQAEQRAALLATASFDPMDDRKVGFKPVTL